MPTYSPYSPTLRSEEVQELITRVPNWLVRWGTVLIFLLVAGLLVLSWVIRYPDIVPASFRLTSVNAPKSVLTRTDGKLIRLFVKDGQTVRSGQVMAYLESTASHDDVLRLEGELERAWCLVSKGNLEGLDPNRLTHYRQLGELQPTFQTFEQSLTQLQAYLNGHFYSQNKELLQQELGDLQAMADNLHQQQQLQQRDGQLAQEEYAVQKKLADEKLIAPLDLKHEESRRLARTLPYRQTGAALIQNETAQRVKRQELLALDRQVLEYRTSFLQQLNTLRSAVDEWKSRYVVVAALGGRVSFPLFLEENQFIANQQELFTIAPASTDYFGLLYVPQVNFGKVKAGQTVLIKFAGYPFEQYGYVRGQIASIADVPVRDSVFLAKVTLPDGLTTTYHRKLGFRTGMAATAEIVTEDTRLLQRFLYRLRQAGDAR